MSNRSLGGQRDALRMEEGMESPTWLANKFHHYQHFSCHIPFWLRLAKRAGLLVQILANFLYLMAQPPIDPQKLSFVSFLGSAQNVTSTHPSLRFSLIFVQTTLLLLSRFRHLLALQLQKEDNFWPSSSMRRYLQCQPPWIGLHLCIQHPHSCVPWGSDGSECCLFILL